MAHAEKCPVCGGSGKVQSVNIVDTCHGCGGKGWVAVGYSGEAFYPFEVYPHYCWPPCVGYILKFDAAGDPTITTGWSGSGYSYGGGRSYIR